MKHTTPLISVCIPVFDTEPYLEQCLRSAWEQDFSDFEIVVVSDQSQGRDQKGRTAKRIVKAAQKESKRYRKAQKLSPVQIRFREHHENRGVIEVRRTLMAESCGIYITQLDSDDELEPGALSALYASSDGFDIVHGTSIAGTFDAQNNFTPAKENRYGKIYYGTLYDHDVFRSWLINGTFTANTWGKLIKRELWQRAYENIPYTECNMADDVLLFFFLAQQAKSYKGIETKVYRYRVNSGMSSSRKIDTLHKWKMICSTASVFSVISQWIESHTQKDSSPQENATVPETTASKATNFQIRPDEVEKIRAMTRMYLANNIKQMKETVEPALQEQAYKMLCEYWGEHFVQTAMKALFKN